MIRVVRYRAKFKLSVTFNIHCILSMIIIFLRFERNLHILGVEGLFKFVIVDLLILKMNVFSQVKATDFVLLIFSSALFFYFSKHIFLTLSFGFSLYDTIVLFSSANIYHVTLVSIRDGLFDSELSFTLEDLILVNKSTKSCSTI
jgi:hypothetical protein